MCFYRKALIVNRRYAYFSKFSVLISAEIIPKRIMSAPISTDIIPERKMFALISADIIPNRIMFASISTEIIPKRKMSASISTDIIPKRNAAFLLMTITDFFLCLFLQIFQNLLSIFTAFANCNF